MTRILVKGAEVALPTTTGAGSSFSYATNVRVVNTAGVGSSYLVTVCEGTGGTVVGSFTLCGQTSEIIEKQPAYTLFAANTAVQGASVGFTN